MAPLRRWPRGTTKVQPSSTVEAVGAVDATTSEPAAWGLPRGGGTAALTSPVPTWGLRHLIEVVTSLHPTCSLKVLLSLEMTETAPRTAGPMEAGVHPSSHKHMWPPWGLWARKSRTSLQCGDVVASDYLLKLCTNGCIEGSLPSRNWSDRVRGHP